jgi:16S rRNA (adenine1518-N6/adenine1519-N6)-dimethyltransferase
MNDKTLENDKAPAPAVDTSLARTETIKQLLKGHGLTPRHTLGQNFLARPEALIAAIAAADLGPDDTALEIGPGLGTLTRALASVAGRVTAIELDRGLAEVLAVTVGSLPNVTLVYGDARKVDLSAAVAPAHGATAKVVANLPYYVTTPLLESLVWSPAAFSRIVVLVQAEAVGRIIAAPGDSGYGPLALLVEHFYTAQSVMRVARDAFWPQPNVDSTLVALTRRPGRPDAPSPADRMLFSLIDAAFALRRKTIVAGLAGNRGGIGLPPLARTDVAAALSRAALPADARAERLSLDQFRRLLAALDVVPPQG